MSGDAVSRRQLGRESARGAVWLLLAQATNFVSNLVAIYILARILSPGAFGIMAMANTVANFIMLFRDFGFSAPVLTHKDVTQAQLSGLYWANLALGLALAVITAAVSPGVAWFYGQPVLTAIVSALAVGFIFATTGVLQSALLRREGKFGALALIQIGSSLAAMASGIVAAWLGWGIWSLVCMRLVQQAALGLGAWMASNWRPSWYRRDAELGHLFKMAADVSSSQLTSYFSRNADNILIGWYWGQYWLGLYDQAYKLLVLPMQQLGQPLNSILLPLLSRLEDQPQAYRNAYLRLVEKITLATTPVACAMLILPDVVVRVLLGAKWVEAAPIVAYLGIAMLYQPFSLAAGPLLISQKRSRALAKYSMLAGVLTVVSFVVALPFGPAMVAASYAISGAVIRVPILCRIIGRSGPVTERDQYYAFFTSLWAGGFLAAGYWGLRMVPQLGEHPLYLLIAAALITAPVMLGSLWILPSGRTAIRDAFALLKLLH